MTTSNLLSHLNPSQRQAVEHFCGPLLVVAGAGSGKTRALTHRIAYLIRQHLVDPENILAVTFTNKAAREMKERIERLFAQQLAEDEQGKPLSILSEPEQMQLRSRVYKTYTRYLWMGTFHSLCVRILRFDIEKYKSDRGHTWTKQFSIFDETDAQSLVKDIVTNKLRLDSKKFEPRSVRFAISNAKNRGFSPEDLVKEQPTYRGRVISEVYSNYVDQLAANNALDFDDLLLVPVQLFRQNETILGYWHRRFRHILVDEYQDTNRTQYELIRLLVTNGESARRFDHWEHRSVFVVGDVDQSIYSFRAADFTILMEFQEDFGDRLPDADTRTMVKLEENYRSTENILEVANALIQNNSERIDKVLRPTRGKGEPIVCYRADDEISEAEYVIQHLRTMEHQHPELSWRDFAILYRTNAQSRAFEDSLVKWSIPYTVVGGLRFYDRKEIKDILAYLRSIANPFDTVSLLRVINVPRRGVGKSTMERLTTAAQELNLPLWEILTDETLVKTYAGRSARGVLQFTQQIQQWQNQLEQHSASEMVNNVIKESGYLQSLLDEGTEEADDRRKNLDELCNAAVQFEEENEEATLLTFLASASLASDADSKDDRADRVSLMTLHSSKGLEFPIVFLVGLEQGLFPNFRSMDDPASMEEERRLCYVGITRAQEQLFLTHASERRRYGGLRESAIPSPFLDELPRDLLQGQASVYRKAVGMGKERSTKTPAYKNKIGKSQSQTRQSPTQSHNLKPTIQDWKIGDKVLHRSFGVGQITHIFGTADKMSIAVKFPGGVGQRILDPGLAPIERLPQ